MSGSSSFVGTVMFTDVQSSSGLRTSLGDEEAQRRLRAVQEAVRSVVEEHRGEVVKTTGDGLLASFTSPRQAIYSAVEIQLAVSALGFGGDARPIRLRIGINSGEVVPEDGDLYGEAVDAAARISALAEGGEVLLAGIVKDLAGTVRGISLIDRGVHNLKGFPDGWRLFAARSSAPIGLVLEKTPFVGRTSELTQLERHLDRATRGRGSIVMIGGEPGVGKTRLAEELKAEARRKGAVVFTGTCYEVEAAIPFTPFTEILAETARTIPLEIFREVVGDSGPELAKFFPELRVTFPDIPEPVELPEEQERRYAFNSIGRYITRASAMRPLVLVLDDLHWADEATLQLLQHLSTLIGDLSVLIVATYRDVEVAVTRPLARTLELMVRSQRAHRIALKRLSQGEVAAMLHRLAGSEAPPDLIEPIYSGTEGNPFFVEEVFRHLLEEGRLLDPSGSWLGDAPIREIDVPESVRLVIGRRIERLGPDTRALLTEASVIGRVFDVALLESITRLDSAASLDALDEAERARLIESLQDERAIRYQFVHELVRQTLLSEMSFPRRQQLHLAVAKSIEDQISGESDERVTDLAHHLYQAGAAADLSSTVRYLTAAGDRALATGGAEEALRAYDRALSLIEEDDEGKAHLLYKKARSLRAMHSWDEAIETWHQALESFESSDDAAGVAKVCLAIADRLTWIGHWQAAVDILERGLSAQGDGRLSGSMLAVQGLAYSWLGDYRAGLDRVERAEGIGNELSDMRLFTTARAARAIHHWCFDQHDECIEVGLEVAAAMREAGASWALTGLLWHVHFSLTMVGRWAEADDTIDELVSVAESVGHQPAYVLGSRAREFLAFMRHGDLARSRRAAERDLSYQEEYGMSWASGSYAWLGIVETWQGDWERALELFEHARNLELVERGEEETKSGVVYAGVTRGMVLVHRAYVGDDSGCGPAVAEIRRWSPGDTTPLGRAHEDLYVAEALMVTGARDGLARIHDHVEATVRRNRWRTFNLIPAEVFLAGCKAARGELGVGEELFESALAEAIGRQVVVAQPQLKWLWGMCHAFFGDHERAAGLLEEAASEAEVIGMTRHAEWVRAQTVRLADGALSRADQDVAAAELVFVQEGEFWTIGRPDAPVRLKDTVGLRYLAYLLRNPGREIKALELAGASTGAPAAAVVDEDAGELLDDQAKAAYRGRIEELESELAEATDWADEERAAKLRAELDMLMSELQRATGLGGRDRRAGSTSERARVNVTKAIRAAIKRIEGSDPDLGRHLEAAVRTGTTCLYLPDPTDAPTWRT